MKCIARISAYKIDIETLLDFRNYILQSLIDARFDDKTAKDICKKLFWKKFDAQGKTKANEWFREDQAKEENLKIGIEESTSGIALYHFFKKLLATVVQLISQKEGKKASELSKLKKESEYVNAFLERLCVRNFKINTENEGEITIHYEGVKPKKGIEYSLSEGEKTTLAFAYFLSKYQYEVLDNDSEKPEDYIIVIDDPVSSLDENRLFSTTLVIKEFLVPKVVEKDKEGKPSKWKGTKQVFIFSHNIIFLKFMGNVIDSEQNKGRVDFYLDKGTLSFLPDVLKNYQTSYFYKLNKVKDFVDRKIQYETAKDYLPNYIRVVLEAFLSFKFARLRSKNNKYKPAMLDDLIKHLDGHAHKFEAFEAVGDISCNDTLKSTLQKIKEKTNPESHGTVQDVTHIEYLPESELRETAEQTLGVIQFLDQIHFDRVSNN
ncbi:MAG: AAA family ATPase [Candidatus Thiodiazotropha sp. (ex Lucina pensylvanica)]|nr:AAA family ATPase [Candidatus Thiodiazotropha sp. (ex Lucina pensylvanica)]